MKILRYLPYDKLTSPAKDPLSDKTKIKAPIFFCLPLELRRMIYIQSIGLSRSPNPEDIYKKNLRTIWEDLPSPLLSVNKQIRAEMFDLLHKCFFTLRVTSHGATFDMLGLTCFITQSLSRSYSGLPDLKIEIWPPHPDRPIEMFYIHCHLRLLRDTLRAASHIPKLRIWFLENNIAKWTQAGGQLRFDLSDPGENDPLYSDLAKVLDHFACITNVTEVKIRLPPSLAHQKENEPNDRLRWHASDTIETMRGEGTLAYWQDTTLSDYGMEAWDETGFKKATAQKARAKLDIITLGGQKKMSGDEWEEFTIVWPHFETLTEWDKGGPFKGEWHYREY